MTPFFQVDLSSLGLTTSQGAKMAQWLAAQQAAYPGYSPATTDPAYVQATTFASWYADLARLCATGSSELFRQFGQKLLNLPYQQGTLASAVVTVTAVDTAGHTLPAGSQLTLTLNGTPIGFLTQTGLTIAPGSSSGTVVVVGAQTGALFNGATNPAQLVSQTAWVSGLSAVAPASGGTDQESDDAYLQRLAGTLRTLAPRPITAGNFATLALDFTPAPSSDQTTVGRATAVDGYDPASATFTVSENSTTTLTVTASPSATVMAAPGATITGTNIPANTTVTGATTSTITISNAATATASGITATVGGTLGNQREVTVCVTDPFGVALNADTKTALQTYLASLREVGYIVNVVDPAYTPVYVTVSVKAAAGYTSSTVQASVQAALLGYLTPANFGLPQGANVGWQNSQTVYRSRLTALIQDLPSVDHLVAGSLAIGTSASPSNVTTDLTLGGQFALATSSTSSIPLAAVTVT